MSVVVCRRVALFIVVHLRDPWFLVVCRRLSLLVLDVVVVVGCRKLSHSVGGAFASLAVGVCCRWLLFRCHVLSAVAVRCRAASFVPVRC
eukprot:6811655-Lingulodinium_polyedra.AAC.1